MSLAIGGTLSMSWPTPLPMQLEAMHYTDPWAAQWLWLVANPTQAGFVNNPEEGMYDIVTPELPTTLTQTNFEKGRGLTSDVGRNVEPTLASLGSLSLGLATHNVLTLNDFSKNGRKIPPQPSARTLHLEQQWGQQQCHLVGLQETRAYKEQCVTCKNGFLFLTPSDHGTGGCGLYVDTKHSYGTNLDGDLYFSRKHFSIVATEAETLIVKVKAVDFSAIIVVAHAPSADKGPALREQYWRHVTELLRPHRKGTLLLFADANDELLPTAQPSAFADFLHRHRLATPALHPTCHSGASWTHTSAKGQLKKRLDYVAVPHGWEETDYMESRVAYDADVAITREDHELVTLHTRRHGDGSRPSTFRIVLPYDNPQNPTAAAHAFWRQRLHDGLKWLGSLPDFQAHASVDQHAMALPALPPLWGEAGLSQDGRSSQEAICINRHHDTDQTTWYSTATKEANPTGTWRSSPAVLLSYLELQGWHFSFYFLYGRSQHGLHHSSLWSGLLPTTWSISAW